MFIVVLVLPALWLVSVTVKSAEATRNGNSGGTMTPTPAAVFVTTVPFMTVPPRANSTVTSSSVPNRPLSTTTLPGYTAPAAAAPAELLSPVRRRCDPAVSTRILRGGVVGRGALGWGARGAAASLWEGERLVKAPARPTRVPNSPSASARRRAVAAGAAQTRELALRESGTSGAVVGAAASVVLHSRWIMSTALRMPSSAVGCAAAPPMPMTAPKSLTLQPLRHS